MALEDWWLDFIPILDWKGAYTREIRCIEVRECFRKNTDLKSWLHAGERMLKKVTCIRCPNPVLSHEAIKHWIGRWLRETIPIFHNDERNNFGEILDLLAESRLVSHKCSPVIIVSVETEWTVTSSSKTVWNRGGKSSIVSLLPGLVSYITSYWWYCLRPGTSATNVPHNEWRTICFAFDLENWPRAGRWKQP